MDYDNIISELSKFPISIGHNELRFSAIKAIDAIKELQARAETAEAILDKYQTEIVPRLRERAETAERERDAAIEQLHGNCSACKNFEKNEEAGYFDFVCKHAGVCFWPYGETDNDKWEWNGGDKEE